MATTLALIAITAVGPEVLERATVFSGAGWVLPLVAGAVTAAVAWVLLTSASAHSRPSCDWRATGSVCPECGGSVRTDWRLCPHCGQRMTV